MYAILWQKINEEPKEIADAKVTEIMKELWHGKILLWHLKLLFLLCFLQPAHRYKTKQSITEKVFFFLELNKDERLFFIVEHMSDCINDMNVS